MKTLSGKNQTEDLTVEEAKAFDCCKNMNDKEIQDLLDTIRTFTEIGYSICAKNSDKLY